MRVWEMSDRQVESELAWSMADQGGKVGRLHMLGLCARLDCIVSGQVCFTTMKQCSSVLAWYSCGETFSSGL